MSDAIKKMLAKTTPFDVVDYLKTEEDIAFYLEAVAEDGDPALAEMAKEDVARARERIAANAAG